MHCTFPPPFSLCHIENIGFVDPEIYTLDRYIRTEDKEEGNPYGGSTSSYAGSGTHSDHSYANSIPGGGALSPSPTEHSTVQGE